jgi:hypothetical protein
VLQTPQKKDLITDSTYCTKKEKVKGYIHELINFKDTKP